MNEIVEVVATVPIKKAVEPDLKAVTPAYVWKTGKTFFLSKKETIVADTFLKTRSYAECSRALKKEGFIKSWQTCMRWLEKSHVRDYMAEKLEEVGITAGWTEGRWLLVMTTHIQAGSAWEQASEDEKAAYSALARNVKDADAQISLADARKRKLEASKKRLANGDLFAMKLIAQVKGFGGEGNGGINNAIQINFTERAQG